uniref:Uncharacterized protein n=1 Tax=Anguilla anguilla TaxID=7936 RepID=A0A0E9VCM6_ANGAN
MRSSKQKKTKQKKQHSAPLRPEKQRFVSFIRTNVTITAT